jgi:hypothetical protein
MNIVAPRKKLLSIAAACAVAGLMIVVLYSEIGVCRLSAAFGFRTSPWMIDRDCGGITFDEGDFRFHATASQLSGPVEIFPDGKRLVELSIDRREFGATERLGEPIVSCSDGFNCMDICEGGNPCPDLERGWYRVIVVPTSVSWGPDPRPLNAGPLPGTGYRCGDAGRVGLELCWDPNRSKPDLEVSDIRDVAYPALRDAAAYTWVSKTTNTQGPPAFVATCGGTICYRDIERGSARLQVTFDARELDEWQRFNAGLLRLADHLIKTTK